MKQKRESKKRKLKDEFEAIYLRYNMAKKFMPIAGEEGLKDPDLVKCVKYLSGRFFYRYKTFFSMNGFELEDLRNIINVFALTFVGRQQEFDNERSRYYAMLRFVSQRVQRFMEWISKKFNLDDMILVPWDDTNAYTNAVAHKEPEVLLGLEPSNESLETQISDIQDKMIDLRQVGNKKLPLASRRDAIVKQEEMRQQLRGLKVLKREQTVERERVLEGMRAELTGNPDKYRDTLAHYATTKHTSRDVRKMARNYCKQYGIDYKKWLQEKLQTSNADPTEYTF